MKRILISLLIIASFAAVEGCSEAQDPQFRIRNERTDKVNVQLQNSGGNTININDVGTGITTAYQSASEGTIAATAVIQNVSISPTAKFYAAKGTQSTVVVLAALLEPTANAEGRRSPPIHLHSGGTT